MSHENIRIKHFPVSFFATIMGMSGFSIAIEKAEVIYQPSFSLSLFLCSFNLILFLALASLYLYKIFTESEVVIKELRHPIKLSFFPTISISLILLSISTLNHFPLLAEILWMFGASLHLVFTLFILNSWINHEHFEIHHMNPAWFIPIVGNILVPIAGVKLGYHDISWFFFSIGIVFWPILLAIIFNRLIFHPPLPGKLLPTFFIFIAPPAVGFISYINLNGTLDNFATILYFTGLFFTLLVFSQVKKFYKLEFFLSWWAYSFPLAAISIATMLMYQLTQKHIYSILALILLAILNFVIIILIFKTTQAVLNKDICIEE
ncbi:MAG: SLAC1 anion channel family protein [Pseudomonadota bacterium]